MYLQLFRFRLPICHGANRAKNRLFAKINVHFFCPFCVVKARVRPLQWSLHAIPNLNIIEHSEMALLTHCMHIESHPHPHRCWIIWKWFDCCVIVPNRTSGESTLEFQRQWVVGELFFLAGFSSFSLPLSRSLALTLSPLYCVRLFSRNQIEIPPVDDAAVTHCIPNWPIRMAAPIVLCPLSAYKKTRQRNSSSQKLDHLRIIFFWFIHHSDVPGLERAIIEEKPWCVSFVRLENARV